MGEARRLDMVKFGENHPSTKTTVENMRDTYELTSPTQPFDEWLAAQRAKY